MREQNNLLFFVRTMSEMSDDQIAHFDSEGAGALLSALSELHDEIGEAIVRLAPLTCSYVENDEVPIQ